MPRLDGRQLVVKVVVVGGTSPRWTTGKGLGLNLALEANAFVCPALLFAATVAMHVSGFVFFGGVASGVPRSSHCLSVRGETRGVVSAERCCCTVDAQDSAVSNSLSALASMPGRFSSAVSPAVDVVHGTRRMSRYPTREL